MDLSFPHKTPAGNGDIEMKELSTDNAVYIYKLEPMCKPPSSEDMARSAYELLKTLSPPLKNRVAIKPNVTVPASQDSGIVTHPDFASRPVWEREKYVRLLGTSAGESTKALFDSWIPRKRWFWQRKDHETAYLALCGLAACGGAARCEVEALASGKGRLADAAQKVLKNTPRSKSDG